MIANGGRQYATAANQDKGVVSFRGLDCLIFGCDGGG